MDLGFKINGDPSLRPLGDAFPLYKLRSEDASGHLQNTRLNLEISKGKLEHKYSSIGVQVVSACEWDLSLDWIYREPISDEAFLGDFKWERKCPRVTWDKTTYAKFATFVASKENPPFMNFTLMNPDPMNLWTRDRWTESGVAKMEKKSIARVVSARRCDQLQRPVCQLSQQRMFFEMELGEATFPERI